MHFRYPKSAMLKDYFRGGTGASLFFAPVLAFELPPATVYICLAVGALFSVHVAQTVVRHRTRIDMDDREIRNLANSLSLAWGELNRVALRYFSVRRDGESGWMELKLDAGSRSLSVDSRIEGFERIAAKAARAAAENGLTMDHATLSNFDAIGIHCPVRHCPVRGDRRD